MSTQRMAAPAHPDRPTPALPPAPHFRVITPDDPAQPLAERLAIRAVENLEANLRFRAEMEAACSAAPAAYSDHPDTYTYSVWSAAESVALCAVLALNPANRAFGLGWDRLCRTVCYPTSLEYRDAIYSAIPADDVFDGSGHPFGWMGDGEDYAFHKMRLQVAPSSSAFMLSPALQLGPVSLDLARLVEVKRQAHVDQREGIQLDFGDVTVGLFDRDQIRTVNARMVLAGWPMVEPDDLGEDDD